MTSYEVELDGKTYPVKVIGGVVIGQGYFVAYEYISSK